MAQTRNQQTGEYGERLVARLPCPHCKRPSTLKRLPPNFKCADIVCDFCGFLAQVKTSVREDVDTLPKQILGAGWKPQEERMKAGIYFPLFVVLVSKNRRHRAIYYLPADLQRREMFKKRKPLSDSAHRAGWTGYLILIDGKDGHQPVRLPLP